jgi:hypothetical protein
VSCQLDARMTRRVTVSSLVLSEDGFADRLPQSVRSRLSYGSNVCRLQLEAARTEESNAAALQQISWCASPTHEACATFRCGGRVGVLEDCSDETPLFS